MGEPMFSPSLSQQFHRAGVAATVTIDDLSKALPLAEALYSGGVRIIELTFRTPCAADAIRCMIEAFPDLIVGAGTLLKPEQVEEAYAAGARFGVSPGCNPRIIRHARELGLPFAPGILTPTDIEFAVEEGCRVLKFFPAGPIGGLAYLESMAVPFAHLGVQFFPLGGVNASNLEIYLRSPLIACVGGSILAPPTAIEASDWSTITRLASEATAIVSRVRGDL